MKNNKSVAIYRFKRLQQSHQSAGSAFFIGVPRLRRRLPSVCLSASVLPEVGSRRRPTFPKQNWSCQSCSCVSHCLISRGEYCWQTLACFSPPSLELSTLDSSLLHLLGASGFLCHKQENGEVALVRKNPAAIEKRYEQKRPMTVK